MKLITYFIAGFLGLGVLGCDKKTVQKDEQKKVYPDGSSVEEKKTVQEDKEGHRTTETQKKVEDRK